MDVRLASRAGRSQPFGELSAQNMKAASEGSRLLASRSSLKAGLAPNIAMCQGEPQLSSNELLAESRELEPPTLRAPRQPANIDAPSEVLPNSPPS